MYKNGPRKIVYVWFRRDRRIYEFYTGNFVLSRGDRVIIESIKGLELGTVCSNPRIQDATMPTRPIEEIFRLATSEDIEQKEENERSEAEAMQFCKERINMDRLPMNLMAVELTIDRSKLIFFYTSQTRVDFRKLVKDLAQRFNTHVEMRQIGTRDLAKMQGGVGHCGRQLCCSSFLSNFEPISIGWLKSKIFP